MHIKVHKGSATSLLVMSGLRTNRSIKPYILSEPVEPVNQLELNHLKRFASQLFSF